MSHNMKKAIPVGDATGRARAGAETSRDTTSTKHDTTVGENRQFRIADLLLRGEENALPLRHIKQFVNLPGREIRRQIQMEREAHIPIVSGRNGYYIAANNMEKDRFVRGMKRRANEIIKVVAAVGKAKIGGE